MKPTILPLHPILFSLAACLLSANCFSQDAHLSNPDAGQISFVNFDPAKDVFTMSGSRITANEQSDVNGSPYLLPSWTKGTVIFANGKVYRDGLLQLNLVSNQLQFLNNGKPLVFAAPVKNFTLVDTSGGQVKSAWFNSGYPSFGMHNEGSFYQVLAIGPKVHLLKFIAKHSADQYQYNGQATLFYKATEDLLVYDVKGGKLHIISANAGSVEKVLKDVSENAAELVNKLHKKKLTEADLIGLVNQLNQ